MHVIPRFDDRPKTYVSGTSEERAAFKQLVSSKVGWTCGGKSGGTVVFSGESAITACELAGVTVPDTFKTWKPKQPWNNRRYTDEEILAEAKKYAIRGAFIRGSSSHYQEAYNHRRVLLKQCYAHMEPPCSPFRSCYHVYAYEFADGAVYTGLTCRLSRRHRFHMTNRTSPVFQHLKVSPLARLAIESGHNAQQAADREIELIAAYGEMGWQPLNSTAGGETGGSTPSKWTYEKVRALAQAHKTRNAFLTMHVGAGRVATARGWMDPLATEFNWPEHAGHRWDYESCLAEAKQFTCVRDWVNGAASSYMAAHKHGWVTRIKRVAGLCKPAVTSKWTRATCLERARQFTSRSGWQYGCGDGSYKAARTHSWLRSIAAAVYGTKRAARGRGLTPVVT